MGTKSKKEGIYVYVWLIHFAAQQKKITVKQPYFNNFFLKEYIEILDRLITGSKKESLIKKTKPKKPPYK